jgi:hypothetical protein
MSNVQSMPIKIKNWLKRFFIPCEDNHFRPKSLENGAFLAYIAVAIVLKVGLVAFFTEFPKTLFYADITRSAIVALTNESRVSEGLSPLQENPVLERAAAAKAGDLMSKGYFAHTSPDGKSPWYWFSQAGYKYAYAGENLAIDFLESADVVKAWLASPGHRANMENPNYKDIGIAVLTGKFGGEGGGDRIVVVQLFGQAASAPKKVLPAPRISPTPKPVTNKTISTPQASPAPVSPIPQPTTVPVMPEISDIANPAPSPSASSAPILAGMGPVSPEAAVLEAATPEEVRISDRTPVAALLLVFVDRFSKGLYLIFLIFAVTVSLLNVLVRRDIQHADLVARALMLTLLAVMLAGVGGSMGGLNPGIL